MTKRDVCIWFCKVVALVGIIGAAMNMFSGLIGWRVFGGATNFVYPLPALALYGFVWLFSKGIGTELAAEGEYGSPLTTSAGLGSLLLRCGGLWLFLSASLSFGVMALGWAYEYFVSKPATPSYYRYMMPHMIGGFVQSVIGFLLAFTPRFRAALGK